MNNTINTKNVSLISPVSPLSAINEKEGATMEKVSPVSALFSALSALSAVPASIKEEASSLLKANKKSSVLKHASVSLFNALFAYAKDSTLQTLEAVFSALFLLCALLDKPVPMWDSFYKDSVKVVFKGNEKDGYRKFIDVRSPSILKKAILCSAYTVNGSEMAVPAMEEKKQRTGKGQSEKWTVVYAGYSMEKKCAYQDYKAAKAKAKLAYEAAGQLDKKFTFIDFEDWYAQQNKAA